MSTRRSNAARKGEVVDFEQRSAAAVAVPSAQAFARSARAETLALVGTAPPFTPEQLKVLRKPTPWRLCEIKPYDGAVYVPVYHYRRALNRVFGEGQWGVSPVSEIGLDTRKDIAESSMYREYALVVHVPAKGRVPASRAVLAVVVGQADYHPADDGGMSWPDAAESVRSNAIMRSCKDLGLYLEPWDPAWCDAWRAKRAVRVQVHVPGEKPRIAWRRKDGPPLLDEIGPLGVGGGEAEEFGAPLGGPGHVGDRPVGQQQAEVEKVAMTRVWPRGDGDVYCVRGSRSGECFTAMKSLFETAKAAAGSNRWVRLVCRSGELPGDRAPRRMLVDVLEVSDEDAPTAL